MMQNGLRVVIGCVSGHDRGGFAGFRDPSQGGVAGISSLFFDRCAESISTQEFDSLDKAPDAQGGALGLDPITVASRLGAQLMVDMSAGDFAAVVPGVEQRRPEQGHAVGPSGDCDEPAIPDFGMSGS